MLRLIWATLLVFTTVFSAFAETLRPETLDDTLILLRDQFEADPRVSSTDIDLAQRYISFRIGDGPVQISLPDTIHDTLQNAANDAKREQALLQFVDFTIEASQSLEPEATLDLAQILPVIRPTGFGSEPLEDDPNHEGLEDEEELSAPVSLPFTADMEIFFVQDRDQIIEFVTVDHLAQLEISPAELLRVARENLQTRDWDLSIAGGDGLHIVSIDGDFETSFMLNKPFWQGVSVGLGQVVAVVAARDLVLFVDGSEVGAIDNLRTLVDPEINQFPNPISTTPIRWNNGIWVPVN